MRLLLDTCTFLWIVGGAKELSSRAREAFADPANEVFLSAASAWEIAVKHRLGKLPLPAALDEFVPAQRAAHGIEPLTVEEESALHVAKLPDLHRDPFDRMLVGAGPRGWARPRHARRHHPAVSRPDPLVAQPLMAGVRNRKGRARGRAGGPRACPRRTDPFFGAGPGEPERLC